MQGNSPKFPDEGNQRRSAEKQAKKKGKKTSNKNAQSRSEMQRLIGISMLDRLNEMQTQQIRMSNDTQPQRDKIEIQKSQERGEEIKSIHFQDSLPQKQEKNIIETLNISIKGSEIDQKDEQQLQDLQIDQKQETYAPLQNISIQQSNKGSLQDSEQKESRDLNSRIDKTLEKSNITIDNTRDHLICKKNKTYDDVQLDRNEEGLQIPQNQIDQQIINDQEQGIDIKNNMDPQMNSLGSFSSVGNEKPSIEAQESLKKDEQIVTKKNVAKLKIKKEIQTAMPIKFQTPEQSQMNFMRRKTSSMDTVIERINAVVPPIVNHDPGKQIESRKSKFVNNPSQAVKHHHKQDTIAMPRESINYQPRRPSRFQDVEALMHQMEQGSLTQYTNLNINQNDDLKDSPSRQQERKVSSKGSVNEEKKRNSSSMIPKEFEEVESIESSSIISDSQISQDTVESININHGMKKVDQDMQSTTIVMFEDTNINQLIHQDRKSGVFADIWANIRMFTITYNFLAVWYYLGMVGFPQGLWLLLEIFVEVISVLDFLTVCLLKIRMPNQWRTMWLLQEKSESRQILNFLVFTIACFPQSFFFCLLYQNTPEMLSSLQVAALRSLKLLRLRQIAKFFETKEIEYDYDRQNTKFRWKSIYVLFIFLLSTHMIGCIWLIVGRIDPDPNNWFVMAKYKEPVAEGFNNRNVTTYEKYIDSVFYVVATMTGLGYGNVVPSTNLEWFVDIFIMITGSSIYVGFFADFAVEIYNQNTKLIENDEKLEQAKNFGTQRNLPEDLRQRIKLYYHSLRLNFLRLKEKFKILHQLPLTLRSELCLFFNNDLIQKVKFFQLSDPSFILAMCRCLTPQICLRKDFVVEIDHVATKMYFIEQGIVQILATDSKTVIAFQSQGCYFGEIGLLLTDKRSCSVKAVTMCIFMTITKEQLEEIFESYPEQGKFLRAVGRQRLLTTAPEDLNGYEENLFDIEDGHNAYLQDFDDEDVNEEVIQEEIHSLAKFGRHQSNADSKLKKPSESNISQRHSIIESAISKKLTYKSTQQDNPFNKQINDQQNHERKSTLDRKFSQRYRTPSFTSQNIPIKVEKDSCFTRLKQFFRACMKRTSDENGIPWNLTSAYRQAPNFVIIPFSKLFNIWTSVMYLSTSYFLFIVPFQLALNYNIEGTWFRIVDICLSLTYIIDIFFRSRSAFIINERGLTEILTNVDIIQNYYVNNMLIFDILAAVPLDYILMPFGMYGSTNEILRYIRILKLVKFFRLLETIKLFQQQSNIDSALMTFSLYAMSYILISHYMATSYIFVGSSEYKKNGRFDGQTMFGDLTNRDFLVPTDEYRNNFNTNFTYQQPPKELSPIELYIPFLYLSSCTMGAVMYGDIIPFALSEQLIDFIDMFACRLFLAFLFAESASYLSRMHSAQTTHTNRLQRIKDWSNLNHFPNQMRDRIVKFYEILWKNFRGVRQTSIIKNLPATLRMDVKQHIFKSIVDNWDVVLGITDKGILGSIISKLEIRIIPKNEYIVKYGEIARSMYFIVKGQVYVISDEGINLATLDKGKYFGEMALYTENKVRTASVRAATDISVAIMTNDDFDMICEVYPIFRQRVQQVVKKRKEQNKITISKVKVQTKKIKKQIEKNFDQTVVDIGYLSESNSAEEQKGGDDYQSEVIRNKEEEDQNKDQQQDENIGTQITGGQISQRTDTNIDKNTSRKLIDHSKSDPKIIKNEELEIIKKSTIKKQKTTQVSQSPSLDDGDADKFLDKRLSNVPLRAAGIQSYFKIGYENDYINSKQEIISKYTFRYLMKCTILCLIVYNIIFIPLQMAYRIDYNGFFILLEVFTIIFYCLDTFFRVKNLHQLNKTRGNLPNSDKEYEKTMMDNIEHFKKRTCHLKIEIITNVLAIIPFSFIFQTINFHDPLLFCNFLSLLRLVKVLPLIKLFDSLRSENMQKFRILEVMIIYYTINHILCCNWISMGLHVKDVRETWIRRIPIPQKYGMRGSATVDDIGPISLYIHSLYFNVNTISHVAIGDITAVNLGERVYVAILILFGTFIYCFLFGNIVSIVSDFAPNQQHAYFEKYQFIQQRLGKIKKNKALMAQINEYFDYIWGDEQYSIEEHFMSDLPNCIRSDILLCKYQEAIENSIIFKDDSGAIDVSLTNSIFKLIEVRIYMTNEFIIKCGQSVDETLIVLEGEAILISGFDQKITDPATGRSCIHESQVVGMMKVGSHFGNDLPQDDFNFCNKAICHMVCRQPSVIGVINKKRLNQIYDSFPLWQEKVQNLNQLIFNRCEKHLIKHDKEIQEKLNQYKSSFLTEESTARDKRLYYIENHLTYSRDEVYNRILRGIKLYENSAYKQIYDQNDILLVEKMFYYAQEGKKFPIFDTPYQEALKTRSQKDLVLQMLAGKSNQRAVNGSNQAEKSKFKICLEKFGARFYLKINSRSRKLFDFIQFINLLYLAVSTPLIVAFQLQMTSQLILVEWLSIILSISWVIGNFRTQVLIKGVPTLKIQTLFKHYMLNGLVLDICGCVPFQIALNTVSFDQRDPFFIIFVSVLRCIRVVSVWRAVQLFGKAEIIFRNNYLQVIKAFLGVFFLGHFLTCQWFWFVSALEQGYVKDKIDTWMDYQQLRDPKITFSEKYLRSIYLVFNIVCSVGYGDMFPMTDPERVFFTYLMSFGDLMFALAFGLITRVTLQISLANETRLFKEKMHNIQEFMTSFKLDLAQQRRVEQYFAYEYQQKYNSNMLMYVDLVQYLPFGLREEVMYQSFKELLTNMFQEYKSENLIRQLSCVLESQIFLPGDYIIFKGDIGDEMYFIAEGSVFLLSSDKQNIMRRMGKGGYFGEIAVLTECKRQDYVQAETFCIIIILKKNNFDIVSQNFPEIEVKLRLQAAKNLEDQNIQLECYDDQLYEDINGNKHRDLLNKLDELSVSQYSKKSKKMPTPTQKSNLRKHHSVIKEESSSVNSSSFSKEDGSQSEWPDQSNPTLERGDNSIRTSDLSNTTNSKIPTNQSPRQQIFQKSSSRSIVFEKMDGNKSQKKNLLKKQSQDNKQVKRTINDRRKSHVTKMTKIPQIQDEEDMEDFFSPRNLKTQKTTIEKPSKSPKIIISDSEVNNQMPGQRKSYAKRDSVIPTRHPQAVLEFYQQNSKNTEGSAIRKLIRRSSNANVIENPDLKVTGNATRRLSVKDLQLISRNSQMTSVQSYGQLGKDRKQQIDGVKSTHSGNTSSKKKIGRPTSSQSPAASLNSLFRGGKDQPINHSIRRTAASQAQQDLRNKKFRTSKIAGDDQNSNQPQTKVVGTLRRLSRVSLGKRLTLSQTAGLKLQWAVTN